MTESTRLDRMNSQAATAKVLPYRTNYKMFPGDRLFELHATNGIPLDVAINKVYIVENLAISWDRFIDQARKNKRWDFQIIDLLENGLKDACVEKRQAEGIIQRAKQYMLDHPL